MAYFGFLKFGDNESGRYYKTYNAVDVRMSVSRIHSGVRPTGNCHCDSITVTLPLPAKDDLYLFEWLKDASMVSGCIVIEEPVLAGDKYENVIKFENARCSRISEYYDMNVSRRQSLVIEFVPQKMETEGFAAVNKWAEE